MWQILIPRLKIGAQCILLLLNDGIIDQTIHAIVATSILNLREIMLY